MRRHVPVLRSVLSATLLSGAVLLTGCAEDEDDGAPPAAASSSDRGTGTAAPSATSQAAPTVTSQAPPETGGAAPLPADVAPEVVEPSPDALLTVSAIRIGGHDGFDRVVFEVDGRGNPGWDARYVDRATSQGSGDPLDVAGNAILQVSISGIGYPYETGVEEFVGPNPLPAEGTTVVDEVVFDATFEGTTVSFVGTSARTPFRVYLLENPRRVVVDVQHES